MNNELAEKIESMYESGKITEAQRDALLTAIAEDVNTDAGKQADRGARGDLDRDMHETDSDLDDDEEQASGEFSFTGKAGGKSLQAMLKNLGKQISEVVKSGTSVAIDAFSSTDLSLENAQNEIERAAAELSSLFGNGTMEKRKQVKFDAPYDKLNITIKYVGDSSHVYAASAGDDPELIKTECAKFLPSEVMTKLSQLLDEHFTGRYKLIANDFVFKFTVDDDE